MQSKDDDASEKKNLLMVGDLMIIVPNRIHTKSWHLLTPSILIGQQPDNEGRFRLWSFILRKKKKNLALCRITKYGSSIHCCIMSFVGLAGEKTTTQRPLREMRLAVQTGI